MYPEIDDPAVLRAVLEWARRGASPDEVLRSAGQLPEGADPDQVIRAVAVATAVLRAHKELTPEPGCWGAVRHVAGDELHQVRDATLAPGLTTSVERAVWETANPGANQHYPCELRIAQLSQRLNEADISLEVLRRQLQAPCSGCAPPKKPFSCDVCGSRYSRHANLVSHMVSKHSRDRDENGSGRRRRREGAQEEQAA